MATSEAEKGFAELHGPGPLTDLEVERALDDLEASHQDTYDTRIGSILDETTDYNDRLENLWKDNNFEDYVRLSERMHDFHQSVEDFLTYQPEDIERNKELEGAISDIYSKMMPLDEERRLSISGSKDFSEAMTKPAKESVIIPSSDQELDMDKVFQGLRINEEEPPINSLNPTATLPADNRYRDSLVIPKPQSEEKGDEVDLETLPDADVKLVPEEELPTIPEEDLELIPVPWEKPRREEMDPRKRDFLIGLNLYASELYSLKKAFERSTNGRQPSEKLLGILHEGLDDLKSRLEKYDLAADADIRAQVEKAYTDLQDEIAALEDRYPIYVLADLSSARRATRRSMAHYASIQHQLPADERRALRSRIARLASTVRSAEDARWSELFAAHFRNPKREYLRSPRHLEAMTAMKMARAERIAPVLASRALTETAIHGFPSRPQGVLAAIIKSLTAE
jgi:hypothetical protein